MLPRGSEAKLIIEGGHTIDLYLGHPEIAGHFHHRLPREVAKTQLQLLKNRNETASGAPELPEDFPGLSSGDPFFLALHFPTYH